MLRIRIYVFLKLIVHKIPILPSMVNADGASGTRIDVSGISV